MITTTFYSVLYFVIVLGVLVFIHEFGHFLLAKKLGVGVLTFSLGFGPRLIGKKIGETQYQVSAVPLGGYVKLMGENPGEELKEEDRRRSFSFQPIWKRALIICAGPFFNIFLAVVLLCFTFLFYGVPQEEMPLPSKIGGVSQDLPADKAGIKKGDTVISIDGVTVSTWNEVSDIIRKSEGKEIVIQVKRNEKVLEFKVRPEMSKEKIKPGEKVPYIIGISAPLEDMTFRYERVGAGEALWKGIERTWFYIKFTVVVVAKMITGEISRKNIGGPIEIARQAGVQGSKGLPYLLSLMVLLGVNLGLLNLFPIPILDGGHLLFLAIEAVIRRPISIRKMEIAQQVGLGLIILLMVFAFYNDLLRLFSSEGIRF